MNGCQTSHIVYYERATLKDDIFIPIRLISTDDDDTVNKIITATNSQTEVKPDQLYALSEFQKTLEQYYKTFDGQQKLHYERRSKQYAGSSDVDKVRIVTILQQIRAFASMFLDQPHRGHYPRSIPDIGKVIFGRDHKLDPYHLSAFALFKLEGFFRSKAIPARYKPARYHLLMGARHILLPLRVPQPSANEMERFCKKLLPLVDDDKKLLAAYLAAAKIVDKVVGKKSLDRSLTKTQPFTEDFADAIETAYPLETPSGKKKI